MSRDWRRMLIHVSPGVVGILLIQVYRAPDWLVGAALVAVAGLLLTVMDVARLLIRWCHYNFGWFQWMPDKEDSLVRKGYLREYERRGPCGAVFYALGIWLVFEWYGGAILLTSGLVLVAGDPAASFAGKRWPISKPKNGKKTVGGFLGFIVAALIMTAITDVLDIWCGFYGLNKTFVFAQIVAVVAGALAESLSWRYDNFFVPVCAAATLALII